MPAAKSAAGWDATARTSRAARATTTAAWAAVATQAVRAPLPPALADDEVNAGEREKDEVAPRHESRRQAVLRHHDLGLMGHRRLAEILQPVRADNGVVAQLRRPCRKRLRNFLAHGEPRAEFDRVALAVMEADGLHMGVAVERPGKRDGGILPAGEEDERAGRVELAHGAEARENRGASLWLG